MGQKFERIKKRNILNSIIYKVACLNWFSNKNKFEFFANLEWIFHVLAHESWMNEYLDSKEHPSREFLFNFIRDKVPTDARIMDLGCGNGEISACLGQISNSVIGVDKDPKKIRNAQVKYKSENVKFICSDALNYLQNCPDKFDVLFLSHILEHLDEPIKFLNDFKSEFRYIYIEVPDFENSYINIVRKRFNCYLNYADEDHIHEFDREEMISIIMSINGEILNAEYRNGVMRFWIRVN